MRRIPKGLLDVINNNKMKIENLKSVESFGTFLETKKTTWRSQVLKTSLKWSLLLRTKTYFCILFYSSISFLNIVDEFFLNFCFTINQISSNFDFVNEFMFLSIYLFLSFFIGEEKTCLQRLKTYRSKKIRTLNVEYLY